jgi:hypothetical protein
MRPDATGRDAEGVTLSTLSVVAVEPGLPKVSTAAGGPVRRLPAERAVKRAMKQRQENTVMFLCAGNYYRSRYAGILFNSVAGKMGLPWSVKSWTWRLA